MNREADCRAGKNDRGSSSRQFRSPSKATMTFGSLAISKMRGELSQVSETEGDEATK